MGIGSGTHNYLGASNGQDFGSPVLSPFADDLYTGDGLDSGGVYGETRGNAPNRELVIEWDVNPCCDSGSTVARFQAIFHEDSPVVETLYSGTLPDSGWAGVSRDSSEWTDAVDGGDGNISYPAADTHYTYTPLTIQAATRTADDTPTFTGSAFGNAGDVTVDVFSGTDTSGTPLSTQTLTPNPDGTFTATVDDTDALADGTYTVRASQSTGGDAEQTFTVDTTGPATTLDPVSPARLPRTTPRSTSRSPGRQQARSASAGSLGYGSSRARTRSG